MLRNAVVKKECRAPPRTARMKASVERNAEHELELLDRSRLALLDHGRRRDQRAVQDQQQTEDARGDEPGVDEPRVVEEHGHQMHLPARARVGYVSPLDAGLTSRASQLLVVALDHAFRIGLHDCRGIGIRGVQQKLHRRGAPAPQVASVVVQDDNARVQLRPTTYYANKGRATRPQVVMVTLRASTAPAPARAGSGWH